MADPVEIILEFLQRNQFAKAEAAFKAELLSRSKEDDPNLLSENVIGWDLQLRSSTTNNRDGAALDGSRSDSSINEQMSIFDLERRLPALGILQTSDSDREEYDGGTSTGRARSPPEKRLYVESESAQSNLKEASRLVSQDFEFVDNRVQSELVGSAHSGQGHVSSPSNEFEGAAQVFSSQRNTSNTVLRPSPASSAVTSSLEVSKRHNGMIPSEPEPKKRSSQSFWQKQLVNNFDSFAVPEDSDKLLSKVDHQRRELVINEMSGPQRVFNMDMVHVSSVTVDRPEFCLSRDLKVPESNLLSLKALSDSERTRIPEARGGALQLHNGFLPRSMKEGSFTEPVLKTSLPLSMAKVFHKEDHQRSATREYDNFGDERDTGGYSWNDNELQKFEINDPVQTCRAVDKMQFLGSQESSANGQSAQETLPRLPPVRIHSVDKNMDTFKESGFIAENENATRSIDAGVFKSMANTAEEPLRWGVLVDGSIGQDMSALGLKRAVSRPSVSQGIVEDLSEQLCGFPSAIDGQSERWYPDDYCDSDTWEDDEDPGYHRQPIEDEELFLTNEIDYPSDDERARQHTDKTLLCDAKQSKKVDEDDRSFIEEESYFSGEEYYRQQIVKKESHRSQVSDSKEQIDRTENTYSTIYLPNDDDMLNFSRSRDDGNEYDGHLYDSEDINLLASQPAWKGFMYQADQLGQMNLVSSGYQPEERRGDHIDDDNHGSVRSGLLISSDAADVGSEVRDSLLGGSSEGDAESMRYQELVPYGPSDGNFRVQGLSGTKEGRHVEVKSAPVRHHDDDEDDHDAILQFNSEEWGHTKESCPREATRRSNPDREQSKDRHSNNCGNKASQDNGGFVFEGFSFPSPSSTCDVAASRTGSGKSLWSNRESTAHGEEIDGLGSVLVGPDDTLAAWKRKSNTSSPGIGSSEDNHPTAPLLNRSPGSPHSTDEYVSLEEREDCDVRGHKGSLLRKDTEPSALEDDEAAAAQEELRTFGTDEDQYEIFDLRIIHRKNRTGFEEDKDFPVMINSVIAGRYHVTEYLGAAAFSRAIQARDLYTGMDVCMKIIKNNKDFFDQSLDEIKLLKFVNKHDPADKYHILRLYDYFYHREHLFIVCELLRANLFEFHKFNRESGGEVYFTMPRLQSITVQCLEALEFLHRLGIIHCDLKPENILVKSYSRCEIKIIDLGSSCFQTDHLCPYVQSRSYRAPEVILGLPYDQKIDIWSLGCILAELCTGNVLFQNDSLATLLARVVGILGPIDPEVLSKGRDTHKYFTKNHLLYERNQETDQLEYLIPKRTSLSHRLPMGDQGFVEFVGYLLQNNPTKRPSASEALRHPWLSYPYEPISS